MLRFTEAQIVSILKPADTGLSGLAGETCGYIFHLHRQTHHARDGGSGSAELQPAPLQRRHKPHPTFASDWLVKESGFGGC